MTTTDFFVVVVVVVVYSFTREDQVRFPQIVAVRELGKIEKYLF